MFKFVFCLFAVWLILRECVASTDLSGFLQDFVNQNFSEVVVKKECEKDLTILRTGLLKREIWALKLLDASGHTGSDFIWGNNIFIGSPKSCKLINTFHGYIPNSDLIKSKTPMAVDYQVAHIRHWSTMQFRIGAIEKNVVDIGLCIPRSCGKSDMEILFRALLKSPKFVNRTLIGPNMMLIKTRELKISAATFDSTPFKILGVITIIIFLLIIINLIESIINKFYANNNLVKLDYTSNEKMSSKSKIWKKLVHCFSITENAAAITTTTLGYQSIECLHGLRVISMILLIVGHVAVFTVSATLNVHHIFVYDEQFWAQPLMTLHLSVDTFFVISGLVLSHSFFQHIKKNEIKNKMMFFIKMVLNRYVRLTPPYIAAILLTSVATRLIKDASPYYLMDDNEEKCSRMWWYNLLNINNFVDLENTCMIWTWFLAADFQCFLLSAILLLVLSENRIIGEFLFGTVFLLCASVTGYFGYALRLGFSQDMLYKTSKYLYTPFWSRVGPYFVGIFAGRILSHNSHTIHMDKKMIVFGWTICIISIILLIFLHALTKIPAVVSLIYAAIARTIWALAIGWIILACTTGFGGIVNNILSAKVFIPLSRMTYFVYLINPIWITFITMINGAPYYLDFPMLMISSVGFACTVFFLAFIFMLLYESPFIRINKILSK